MTRGRLHDGAGHHHRVRVWDEHHACLTSPWLLVGVCWAGIASTLAAVGRGVTIVAGTLAVIIGLLAFSSEMRVVVVMIMVVAASVALLVSVTRSVRMSMFVRVLLR